MLTEPTYWQRQSPQASISTQSPALYAVDKSATSFLELIIPILCVKRRFVVQTVDLPHPLPILCHISHDAQNTQKQLGLVQTVSTHTQPVPPHWDDANHAQLHIITPITPTVFAAVRWRRPRRESTYPESRESTPPWGRDLGKRLQHSQCKHLEWRTFAVQRSDHGRIYQRHIIHHRHSPRKDFRQQQDDQRHRSPPTLSACQRPGLCESNSEQSADV
jgi:hypothetical protein